MVFQAGAIAEIHELGLGSSLQQQTAGRLGCAAIRNLLSVTQHNRGRLTQFFFTLLQVARISVSNSRLLYFIVQRGKSLFVNLSNDTCVDKIFLELNPVLKVKVHFHFSIFGVPKLGVGTNASHISKKQGMWDQQIKLC